MSAPRKEIDTIAAVNFLNEAAHYFANCDTGGEDAAYWANVSNAETCRKISDLILKLSAPK